MSTRLAFYRLCAFLALVTAILSPAHADPSNLVVEKLEVLGTRLYWGSHYTNLVGPGQYNWVLPGEILTLRATLKNAGGADGVGSAVALQALLHFQKPTWWLPKHVYKPQPFGEPVTVTVPEPGRTRIVALNVPVEGALDDGLHKVGLGMTPMQRGAVRQDVFKDGPAGDSIWLMPHRPHLRIKEIRFRTISGGAIWQIYSARVLIRNEGSQGSWPAKLWIGIGNNCQTDHTVDVPNINPGEELWLQEEFGYDPQFWQCTPHSIDVLLKHEADGTEKGGSGDSLSTGPHFLFKYSELEAFNAIPPPPPVGKPPAQTGRLTVLVPGKGEIIHRPNGPMKVLVDGVSPQVACVIAFEKYDYEKEAWTSLGQQVEPKVVTPSGWSVWPFSAGGKTGKYRLRAEAGNLKSDWIEYRVARPIRYRE